MDPSYRLSDQTLRIQILDQFSKDVRTANAQLRVGVRNGVVHLAGKTETLAERSAAEEIAQGTQGVRGVANRIETPGAPNPARTINLKIHETRI